MFMSRKVFFSFFTVIGIQFIFISYLLIGSKYIDKCRFEYEDPDYNNNCYDFKDFHRDSGENYKRKFVKPDQTPDPNSPRLLLCTQLKNEGNWLVEFIEFHRLVGFDKIVVYDDGSTDNFHEIVEMYRERGKDYVDFIIDYNVDDIFEERKERYEEMLEDESDFSDEEERYLKRTYGNPNKPRKRVDFDSKRMIRLNEHCLKEYQDDYDIVIQMGTDEFFFSPIFYSLKNYFSWAIETKRIHENTRIRIKDVRFGHQGRFFEPENRLKERNNLSILLSSSSTNSRKYFYDNELHLVTEMFNRRHPAESYGEDFGSYYELEKLYCQEKTHEGTRSVCFGGPGKTFAFIKNVEFIGVHKPVLKCDKKDVVNYNPEPGELRMNHYYTRTLENGFKKVMKNKVYFENGNYKRMIFAERFNSLVFDTVVIDIYLEDLKERLKDFYY